MNTEIAQELHISPVLDKIQEYERNWLQYINRMPCNRYREYQKTTDQKAEGNKEDH
jgi:hypothetical protein